MKIGSNSIIISGVKCRICNSTKLSEVLDLGLQPWCNNYLLKYQIGKELFYPLILVFCNNCSTAQLNYTVSKDIMFGNHTYLSGITRSLSEHFRKIAIDVNKNFFLKKKKKNILDIGSNDGTQLKHFKNLGFEILGVESSKLTAKIANDNGIKTLNKFFNEQIAKEINKKFNIINASGVFFHLEELHSVCRGIKYLLKNEGVFIVQFLYIKNIINNVAFDQIYHEHLLYYSLKTLQFLLDAYDIEIFDAYEQEIHGGTMVAYCGHKNNHNKSKRLYDLFDEENKSGCNTIDRYKIFKKDVKKLRRNILNYIDNKLSKNKIIYGMGAPVKSNTIINYCKITKKMIPFLVEKNELRDGLYSPGAHIPIILEKNLKKIPDSYFVFAWNFKNEILKNNKELIKKGVDFFFPINPK